MAARVWGAAYSVQVLIGGLQGGVRRKYDPALICPGGHLRYRSFATLHMTHLFLRLT